MAMLETTAARGAAPLVLEETGCRVSVTETWWGYVIRNERVIPGSRRLLTWVAGFLSVCFALAGTALWLAPASAFTGEAFLMKGAGSSMMAMIALMFSHLATEDPVIEIQVDCRRNELREVSRRPGRRGHLMSRCAFSDIGGVYQDRTGFGRLVARYGNTARVITIAEGSGPAMERIRDRLGRDLMGAPLSA